MVLKKLNHQMPLADGNEFKTVNFKEIKEKYVYSVSWGMPLWLSTLCCHLQCLHPIRAVVTDFVVLLLIQLLANVTAKQQPIAQMLGPMNPCGREAPRLLALVWHSPGHSGDFANR